MDWSIIYQTFKIYIYTLFYVKFINEIKCLFLQTSDHFEKVYTAISMKLVQHGNIRPRIHRNTSKNNPH